MKLSTLTWLALFQTLVTAYPIVERGHDLERRDNIAVTESTLATLKLYSQWAAAAYCNTYDAPGTKVVCSEDACTEVEADETAILGTLDTAPVTNQSGFLAVDQTSRTLVLSLEGSKSVRNWLTDFDFALTPCDDILAQAIPSCAAHAGFQAAWAEIRNSTLALVAAAAALYPAYPIVVTGHSLGGAVGTLAAAHLRLAGRPCDLYTYGSPRVGNDALAEFVTAQPGGGGVYRVTHADDPVPRLPPLLLGYRHTSPEYWLRDSPDNGTDGSARGDADVTVSDVEVCTGYANTTCNAGTSGLDVDAHDGYFGDISGCAGANTFKRRDISDEELAEKLSMLADLDRGYVSGLGAGAS